MKPIDLTKIASKFKYGWIAINKNKKIIAHAKDFASISKKIERKKDVVLVPASSNFFGIMPFLNE